MKFYFKNYTNFSEQENYDILELRNAHFVRENMYHMNVINKTDHLHWLESLKSSKTCKYWGIFLDNQLIGSIDLTSINLNNKFAEWGFYINKKHLGIGALVEYLGLEHFFEYLNFKTVLEGVYEKNKNVYHLHKDKFGFKENSIYNRQEGQRKFYGLTLSKEVWVQRKERIYQILTKVYNIEAVVWE